MLRADFTRKRLFSKLFFIDFPNLKASMESAQRTIFSVSRLNAEVRQLLEQGFGQIWLVGEISNLAMPSSGHWYFTLKDAGAQVKAAMFRNANQRVRMQPQAGLQVMVRAKLTLYEPRGDYQLVVEHMEPAGEGLLQQQFEQLKAKLQAQGWFAAEHKRPLPTAVKKVGIITSPTGAAVRDMIAVLKRRAPQIEVIIYPSAVQGEAATANLRHMLATAQRRAEVDVLVLTRGGGSLEDLWCFNDEQLAGLIYQSNIPIISAVGHEIDFTIADFVADVRAPTPSAAAELVSGDQLQQLQQFNQLQQRLGRAMQASLARQQRDTMHLHARLQRLHPQRQLQQFNQRLDELSMRAEQAMQRYHKQQQQRLLPLQQRLMQQHPARQLQQLAQQRAQALQRAQQALRSQLQQAQQQFARHAHALQIVSPLNTVGRGYALVHTAQGELVRRVAQVAPGEQIQVRVSDGEFSAKRINDDG